MFIDDLKKSILQKAMSGELINGSDYNSREEKKMEDCCSVIETGNSISENIKKTRYMNLDTGYNFIATKDLEFNHSFQYENGVKIPYEEPNFRYANIDDILLCIEGGSAGRKIGILSQKVCYGNKLCKFSTKEFINPKFLYYFLQSPDFQKLFRENINGLIGGVSIGKIRKLILKYPTLEEQKRIVAKLDELMPLLDEAKPLEEQIMNLEKEFPDKLRQSILQYAIQGKLVPQNNSDEPASKLLKKIKEEKDNLIKEGKIKKEKPLEPIKDEEKLFDIPSSWEWVRLGEIFDVTMGQSPEGTSIGTNVNGMEFHQGKIYFSDKLIQNSGIQTNQITKIAHPSSILLCMRAPVGKVNITDREICIGRGLSSLLPYTGISLDYSFYVLQILEVEFIKKSTGSTFKAITGEVVKEQVFPLPPLEEQKRIVAKLDELMKLCDELEEQIG